MIDEWYRNIKLFYGIHDIFAIKRFLEQDFIPTRVSHYIPISIPHFIPISIPFRILSPYPFRSAFCPHIPSVPHFIPISVPHFILISVPQIRSVPHPYPHFNLTMLVQYKNKSKCCNILIINIIVRITNNHNAISCANITSTSSY